MNVAKDSIRTKVPKSALFAKQASSVKMVLQQQQAEFTRQPKVVPVIIVRFGTLSFTRRTSVLQATTAQLTLYSRSLALEALTEITMMLIREQLKHKTYPNV